MPVGVKHTCNTYDSKLAITLRLVSVISELSMIIAVIKPI